MELAAQRPSLVRPVFFRTAGVIIVFAVFIVLAVYYILYLSLSPFETCHLLISREVMRGEVLYRDVAYTGMPWVPYLSGAAMWLFGFGILAGRAINMFAVLVGLVLVLTTLRARTGSLVPGLSAVFVCVASPHWLAAMVQDSGAAFASLAIAVALKYTLDSRRLAVLSAAIVFAAGCDVKTVPISVFLSLVFLLETKKARARKTAFLTLFIVFVLSVLFFVVGFDGRLAQFNWFFKREGDLGRHPMLLAVEWWHVAPAAIFALSLGWASLPRLVEKKEFAKLILLIAGTVGAVVPLTFPQATGRDIAAFIPFATAVGAIVVQFAARRAPNNLQNALWLFPAVAWIYPPPATGAEFADAEIREVAQAINIHAERGTILTPVPAVAVASRRNVLPGTELGMYSVMAKGDEKRARELNLTTLHGLADALDKRQLTAVVDSKESSWSFRLRFPSREPHPQQRYRKYTEALRANYTKVHQSETMTVYVVKK